MIDDGAPCIPVYTYGTIAGDYIDGFQFNTINNTGSGDQNGWAYSDYRYGGTNYITAVAPGGTYTATFTSGPAGGSDMYRIWVDLDHDFTYEPNELLAQAATADIGSQTTMVNVTIPADAPPGYTRMRVMMAEEPPNDPCGTYIFGETEDYTVVIDDGAPCIPVYTVGPSVGDYIDGVTFGTINNIGSGGTTGSPYSSLVHSGPNTLTSVVPGASYPMVIVAGPADGSFAEHYSVWVDLDQDGTFDASEKLVTGTTNTAGEVLQLQVPIPFDAPTGYTRMRVICTYNEDHLTACGPFEYGETEDYTLVIDNDEPCIPLYIAQATQGHYISAVELGAIDWTQPQPSTGYTDATHLGARLQQGSTSSLTMFGGSASYGYLSAWIDWNSNGFDDADLVSSLPIGTAFAQVTLDVTVPVAAGGYYRMRLAHSDTNDDPCGLSDLGSAVDFAIVVDQAGWPCRPLLGYGTQSGDGFSDLTIEGNVHTSQTAYPYYDWTSSEPYHYDAGGSITISFTAGAYAPETYRLSMDMNDNGNFFDTNEEPLIHTSTVAGETITMTYQLPPNCIPGQHFVRLRANDEANYPLVDPCDDQLYGQIFDWVVAVEDPAGPCIPFMNQWTTDGDFIDGVQLGTIENTATGSAYGAAYQDYTSLSTTLAVGQPATLTITGGEYAGNTYSAWIDYNNDNDFDEAGESLGWIGIIDPFGTNDLPFTVPPGTTLGNKRMRVRCALDPMSNACLDESYGETEDYTVNIETSTGVLAATIADLRLLPTPDGVQLLTDASLIGNSYLLLDATGRTLSTGRITSDRTDLSMLAFAKGAYAVQVSNGEAQAVKRFVW